MSEPITITTTRPHGFESGDIVRFSLSRPKWWRLISLWRWWRHPWRNRTAGIYVVTNTTLEVTE